MMPLDSYVVLALGRTGCLAAHAFWENLERECVAGGDWDEAFYRKAGGAYRARVVFGDAEPTVLIPLRRATTVYDPENFVYSKEGGTGNFASSYHGQGAQNLLERIGQRLEAEMKRTETLGGLIVVHCLGGGTGSGLACRAMEKLRQEKPSLPLLSVTILPSRREIGPTAYNTLLGLNLTRKLVDACLLVDSDAVNEGADADAGDSVPAFAGKLLAGTTAPLRSVGGNGPIASLRQIIAQFRAGAATPFVTGAFANGGGDMDLLVEESFRKLGAADSHQNLLAIARGPAAQHAPARRALAQTREAAGFGGRRGNRFRTAWISEERHGCAMLTLLGNSRGAAALVEECVRAFDQAWQSRCYTQWYVQQGITENAFSNCRAELCDIVTAMSGRNLPEGAAPAGEFSQTFREKDQDSAPSSSGFLTAGQPRESGDNIQWDALARETEIRPPSPTEVDTTMEILASMRKGAFVNDRQLVKLIETLRHAAELRLRLGDCDRAAGLMREAAHRLEELPATPPRLAMQVTQTLASLHLQRGDLDQATRYFEQSLAFAGEAGQLESETGARICLHLGYCCQLSGDYVHAREFALQAVRYYPPLASKLMKQTPDTSSQPPRNPWKVNRAGLSTQAAEVARQTIYLPNAQGDTTLWTVESYTRDDSTTGGDSSLALPS